MSCLDQLTGQEQAHPGPSALGGHVGREQLAPHLLGDPGTVVAHRDRDDVTNLDRDLDECAGGCRLDRVVDQVGDRRAQGFRNGVDGGR